MKRVLGAAIVVGLVAIAAFNGPRVADAFGICLRDQVVGSQTLSSTELPSERIEMSIALKGPGDISATWERTVVNEVASPEEFLGEVAAAGVKVEPTITASGVQENTFAVPDGKYGKVVAVFPMHSFENELTWQACDSSTYTTVVTRNHYTANTHSEVELRDAAW